MKNVKLRPCHERDLDREDRNGEMLLQFASGSRLECKIVPVHSDPSAVSSSYRKLFDRTLIAVLEREAWRIVRIKKPRRSRSGGKLGC